MRAAFQEIVDYAGLFPPASCSMEDAVQNYDSYLRSADRWMLGRFVVAASRLEELGAAVAARDMHVDPAEPWRLSAVMGAHVPNEMARITAFHREWQRRGVVVDAVEIKVTSVGQVTTLGEQIPHTLQRYFEVPHQGPYGPLVAAIGAIGGFAKVRTGGTTPEAFPAARTVAEFIAAAVEHRVAFKATAGLHHPFGGSYPLTYAHGAPRHAMFGFVNLLLATAALRRGATLAEAAAMLGEQDNGAFRQDIATITWRGEHFTVAELTATRQEYFTAFGSCSFREPVDELGLGATA